MRRICCWPRLEIFISTYTWGASNTGFATRTVRGGLPVRDLPTPRSGRAECLVTGHRRPKSFRVGSPVLPSSLTEAGPRKVPQGTEERNAGRRAAKYITIVTLPWALIDRSFLCAPSSGSYLSEMPRHDWCLDHSRSTAACQSSNIRNLRI